MIEEILKKITRYNLFNYLLPGVIFVILISKTTEFDVVNMFKDDSVILLLFLSYFLGSILSRIGSLAIEPVLKWSKFVVFADYSDYLQAKDKDPKLDDLSEENNTYRTYISMLVCILFAHLSSYFLKVFPIPINILEITVTALLLGLFLFSYRKQTMYIKKRVNKKIK